MAAYSHEGLDFMLINVVPPCIRSLDDMAVTTWPAQDLVRAPRDILAHDLNLNQGLATAYQTKSKHVYTSAGAP